MCKLAFVKTKDDTAYQRCIDMIRFQENVVAGHSTGIVWRDSSGFHSRKAIGKINSFLAKYSDIPKSNAALGHSRFATVGEINLANQHPISIMFKGHKIGYGVHNGTFTDYKKYEYLRSDIENQTDSALLFTMFGKLLEKLGDSPVNRRIAFGYIMSLIKKEGNHNLIIMFRNGQTIFSGNSLTYKQGENAIGIMTFGFDEKCNDDFIYEVKGFSVNKFEYFESPFKFKPKEPKKVVHSTRFDSCNIKPGRFTYYDYDTEGWSE